jgi:uncharacterized membrane protein HdeD (DUF308 family)
MPVIVTLAGGFLLARPAFLGEAIGVVAGISLIIYGVSEFLSSRKMSKAMDARDNNQVDEQ